MIRRYLKTFYDDRSGATAVEYGIIAAAIAVVLVTVMATLGTDLRASFEGTMALFPG